MLKLNVVSFLKKYIIPHEIDFVGMLQKQALSTHKMIEDFCDCFIEQDEKDCNSIINDEHKTKIIKNKNMHELLNAFITPIDRESIYRAISQLDWISISVKHFVHEVKAYKIKDLSKYRKVFDLIYEASNTLWQGFNMLNRSDSAKISRMTQKITELADDVSEEYIKEMVILSDSHDFKEIFIHREILAQLKEISKRLHVSANTLQDIVIKMD